MGQAQSNLDMPELPLQQRLSRCLGLLASLESRPVAELRNEELEQIPVLRRERAALVAELQQTLAKLDGDLETALRQVRELAASLARITKARAQVTAASLARACPDDPRTANLRRALSEWLSMTAVVSCVGQLQESAQKTEQVTPPVSSVVEPPGVATVRPPGQVAPHPPAIGGTPVARDVRQALAGERASPTPPDSGPLDEAAITAPPPIGSVPDSIHPPTVSPAERPSDGRVKGESVVIQKPDKKLAKPQLVDRVRPKLVEWTASWPDMHKGFLLSTWIQDHHASEEAEYVTPALCALAHFAFSPSEIPQGEKSLDLSILALPQQAPDYNAAAPVRWPVAAALVLLQGELSAREPMEATTWLSSSDMQPWRRMVEVLLAYSRTTAETVPAAAARHRGKSKGPDPRMERDAARGLLLALTRPSRFNFVKGQRLSGHISRQLGWLGRALEQDQPDAKLQSWVASFKPEKQLDQWADEVEPRTIGIVGPIRQAIIRDLQALQSHAARWVDFSSLAQSTTGVSRCDGRAPFDILAASLVQEGETWQHSWASLRGQRPVLVGWSRLLLSRLAECMNPAAAATLARSSADE